MEKYEMTVVTTTYNQEKYIEQCVKSILSQKTNFKYQLIVSNDKSTDRTEEILKNLSKKYHDKLKVINQNHNLGPMENFITTLNEVHTKYVALCDGDDYWTDINKLQKQYDFLEKNLDYNICFHQTTIIYENEDKKKRYYPNNIKETLSLDDLIKENFIPANSVVYRWKYQSKNSLINDFPKNIVPGDYYLHLIHAKGGKIKYLNQPMSVYRIQKEGMWYLTTQPKKQNEFYFLYGEKYYNFYKQVEIKLNKPDAFNDTQKWILKGYIKAIIKKREKDKLLNILKNEYDNNFETISSALKKSNIFDKYFYYRVKRTFINDRKKAKL